jgi:hypothetical protein
VRTHLSLIALDLLGGNAGPARADFFSTLGPGDSYNPGQGLPETGPISFFGALREASSLTVGGAADFRFDGARLALALSSDTNAIPALRLYADAGGQPGAVLESMSVSGTLGPFGGNNSRWCSPRRPPLLQHGQTYWLLPLASGDTRAIWNWNDQGLTGTGPAVARASRPRGTSPRV